MLKSGYQFRRLNPSEFAQIAGRAGRATRNGTFGTTGRCAPFEPELVNALQNHTFDSVKMLQWRNSKLDFASLGSLQVSLAVSPSHEVLTRAPNRSACFCMRPVGGLRVPRKDFGHLHPERCFALESDSLWV